MPFGVVQHTLCCHFPAANQLAETVFEQISEDKSTVTKELYSASVEEMFETFVTIWLMQIKDINVNI